MIGLIFLSAALALAGGATAGNPEQQCTEFCTFKCEYRPLPEFTLDEKVSLSKSELEALCTCLWNKLGSWEKRVAEAIHRGEQPTEPLPTPALNMRAFTSSFGVAIQGCYMPTQAKKADDELILSKESADQMFSMTKDRWNARVEAAVHAGEAFAVGQRESGLGMTVPNPTGFIIVRPNYENDHAPAFIQVTVGFRESATEIVTTESLQSSIQEAKAELSPHYNVIGQIDKLEGNIAVHFIISK